MLRRAFGVLFACLLVGCSGSPQRQADEPSPTPPVEQTSQTPAELPPLPGDDAPAPTSTMATAEDGFTRSCGTVTAASGARLQVILGEGVTDCPMAMRLVRAFHRKIDQPSGSRHPAKATVDGWQCVSGPPSSQGGTTCSRGAATVLAAVETSE